MFKPIHLLLTGLLAAGNLFGQTEAGKSPAAVGKNPTLPTTADESTTLQTIPETAKPSTARSGPPAIPPTSPATKSTDKGPSAENPPAFDVQNMDTSVKPGDDF
jgi:hypothetical protein